jgi:hypothetical protein
MGCNTFKKVSNGIVFKRPHLYVYVALAGYNCPFVEGQVCTKYVLYVCTFIYFQPTQNEIKNG